MNQQREVEELGLSIVETDIAGDPAMLPLSPPDDNYCGDDSTGTTNVASMLLSINIAASVPENTHFREATSPASESSKSGSEKLSQTDDKCPGGLMPQMSKPRVLRVEQKGIYTVKTVESVNVLTEWIKALRISTPYIIRLSKIFWKLSPARVSIVLIANLLKAVMPSLKMWIYKHFLDQVQRVTNGQAAQWRRMILLALMGAGIRIANHGLDVASYIPGRKYCNSNRDKVGGVLETRLMRELDSMLVRSYVRLNSNQLNSEKVESLFDRVQRAMSF
jgi:hypothetical protein